MSATNHTQNYDLSQFVGGDIPSWLNDYNGDMSKIDAAIASVAQGSGDVAADVASLKSRMTSAEADIDAAESNISTLQSTASTQGAAITQNANNITTTNNNVSALDTRVTALENASGGGFDFTITGSVTPTDGSGTVYSAITDVEYKLNTDKSIAIIAGGITLTNISIGTTDTVLASLSIADLPELTSAKTFLLGGWALLNGSNVPQFTVFKIRFNTNKTVDIIGVRDGALTGLSGEINLPPVLYFL